MNMTMPPPQHDVLGWSIVVLGTLATLWTIGACIYWTLRPGETEPDHPKNLIFKDDR